MFPSSLSLPSKGPITTSTDVAFFGAKYSFCIANEPQSSVGGSFGGGPGSGRENLNVLSCPSLNASVYLQQNKVQN